MSIKLLPCTTLCNYLPTEINHSGVEYFKLPPQYKVGNEAALAYIGVEPQEAIDATCAYMGRGVMSSRHAQIIGLFVGMSFMQLPPDTAHKFKNFESWRSADLDDRHTRDGFPLVKDICCQITEQLTGVNPKLNLLFLRNYDTFDIPY